MFRRLVVRVCHRHVPAQRRSVQNVAFSRSPVSSLSCYGQCVRVTPRRAFASNVTEAVFVEKKDTPSGEKNASGVCSVDHDHESGLKEEGGPDAAEEEEDDEAYLPSFPRNWCGDEPNSETYGRIIDAARLIAEVAYDRNEAIIGAMAEAGGEEGAADRWLLGFLSLFERDKALPGWWSSEHRDALLRLANRRNRPYYIKRCLDIEELKRNKGRDSYAQLEMVAFEVYMCIDNSMKLNNIDNDDNESPQDDDDIPPMAMMAFSKDAVEQAQKVWGELIVNELHRKTFEEIANERKADDMEEAGVIGKVEQGDWWGEASDTNPSEAYRRLIDAARFGTVMAYNDGEVIGTLLDATEDGDDAQENMSAEEREDINYSPDKPGEKAVGHFSQFLGEMKGDNPDKIQLMPNWWHQDHEDALWRLASDKDGMHFLVHVLEQEDIKERYSNSSIRKKVMMMADIAKQVGKSHEMTGLPNDDWKNGMAEMADIAKQAGFSEDVWNHENKEDKEDKNNHGKSHEMAGLLDDDCKHEIADVAKQVAKSHEMTGLSDDDWKHENKEDKEDKDR